MLKTNNGIIKLSYIKLDHKKNEYKNESLKSNKI